MAMKLNYNLMRLTALKWSSVVTTYALWVLVTYLTNVWGISVTKAAGIINIWTGTGNILQIVFAFLVDQFTGKYLMLLLSNIAYTIGLGLLYMSLPDFLSKSAGNCTEYKAECIGQTQRIMFYTSLALIAVGIAGQAVSMDSFFSENETNIKKEFIGTRKPIRFFIGYFSILVPILAGIFLPYIKSWKVQFGVPAVCTLLATLLFISGSRSYKSYCPPPPEGSPLMTVFRVFVASLSKIFQKLPNDDNQLFGKDDVSSQNLPYSSLRFLDKAAIISANKSETSQNKNKWTLCSVAEVEIAKKLVRIVPLCTTFMICGLVISVGNTYFIEQANHLNRRLGNSTIPLSLFLAWQEHGKLVTSKMILGMKSLGLKLLDDEEESEKMKIRRRFGIYAPIVAAFFIHMYINLSCITAAKVEERRLHAVRKHGLLDKPEERIPMSVFWLVPQYGLLASADVLYKDIISHFFAYHAAPCMKQYSPFFHKAVMGLGTIGSVLSVFLVGKISEIGGKTNWFQYTLNRSRLDRYYWTLTGLCATNLVFYTLAVCFYNFKVLRMEEPKQKPKEEPKQKPKEEPKEEELVEEKFEEAAE